MVLREISFEILQSCPNNCIYCSSNSNIKSTNIIDFGTFVKVIDDAVKMGLKTLCLSGGEPFQHPNLLDMVRYAKKYGLEVFIYTSGICMKHDENVPLDLEKLSVLQGLNVDKLIFNMQAAEEGLYGRIMGNKGCFKIMKESIMSTSRLGIFTEIHFVPMKININQINKVIDLASSLGVKKISFLRLVIQGRALKNRSIVELSDEEQKKLQDVLSRIKSNQSNIDIRIGVPLSNKEDNKHCLAASGKLIIKYDGSVFPCEAFKYIRTIKKDKEIMPDNIKNKRLSCIWGNSEFLNVLRNDINKFKNNNLSCESCPAQYRLKKVIGK